MCVICVKPNGIPFPTAKRMEDMFDGNRDGAGFMFLRDGKVEIRKGFMKFKTLMKGIKKESLTEDDIVIMHFRIATAGSVSPQNCHPFPASQNIADLKATNISTDIGIVHNGILSYPHDKKNDLSDTMTFIKEVMAEPVVKDHLFETAITYLIEESIGSSKMAFLSKDGLYSLLGTWYETTDKDGCFYSNLNFQRTIASYFPRKEERTYNNGHHIDYSKYEYIPAQNNAVEEFASQQADAFSHVDYDDKNCPKCDYTIASHQQLACSRCGTIFYRTHEMMH